METWKMIDPYIGAHIRVQVNSSYYHHGIYIGNDEVVQFGKPIVNINYSEISVEKVSIDEFLNGGFLEVRVFDRKEKKSKKKDFDIAKIALEKIGETGYDFLKNNCEHFANYCVFGEKKSTQVSDFHQEIREKLGLDKISK